ncbi:MAG: hypothetical protein IPG06_15345 [Haliea sp.]|nr:hypothetical protein [Haliea sp.]
MNVKDELQDTTEKLRKQREELSVKMHLASMEVRDEWEEIEEKWEEFTAKSKQFYKEVEPSLGEIRTALSLLGSELEAGYQKIKSALKHSREKPTNPQIPRCGLAVRLLFSFGRAVAEMYFPPGRQRTDR